MRAATCSVGLVSPRSTWLSIGADTPERSARSRRERSIASRRTFTRGPTEIASGSADAAIRVYVITYNLTSRCLRPAHAGHPSRMRRIILALLVALALPASASAAGDPRRGEQWGLTQIEADAAHATTTGAGAVIAVVDSGVQPNHPDLAGRLLPGHD